jgi:phage terminase small subunit
MANNKMTAKQQEFADHYLANGKNGTLSYKAVYGVKKDTVASVNAARLLVNANVHAYISEKLAEVSKKLQLDHEWVLRRFKEISDRCMTAVPVMEFDHVGKKMLQKTAINDKGEEVGLYMFDSSGANKATEAIGKHLGFFETDNKQKKPDVLIGLLNVDPLASGPDDHANDHDD